MSRLRAFGLHLLISAAVLALLLGLMRLLWYPGGYFAAMGGGRLFNLLAVVTLASGPLLTLVVFRPGKRGLRFDLAVITSVQLAALAYGIMVVMSARPAFMVFVGDKFRIVSAGMLEENRLAAASRPEWRRISLNGPRLVAAKMPDDPALRAQIVFAAINLIDLDQFPESYVPYSDARDEVLRAAKPLNELSKIASGTSRVVSDFVSPRARPLQAYVFVPLLTPDWKEMSVVLDAETAAYLAILPARPWR